MRARFKNFILGAFFWSSRRQGAAVLLIAVSLAVSAFFAVHLKLKSSIKELLPNNSQSVVELNRLLDKLGGVGTLIVVAESPNVDANKRFMDDLYAKLKDLPDGTIRYVDYKATDIRKFYEDYSLYYIDVNDLNLLYSRLKKRVDYEKMKMNPFFMSFEEGEDSAVSIRLDDIKERNEKNYSAPIQTVDDYYGGEWGRMLIMMIRPYGATLTVEGARDLVAKVEAKAGELVPSNYDPRMSVGTCGNVKSTIEEYDTLKRDILSTALLCVALVVGVIVLYFLRLRIAMLLGITLVVAIAWTFALTKIFIGYLNAQTAFLGSIIVGTGINYGIILLGRYIEERKKNALKPADAMEKAISATIKPTFLAAATTAVSFAILLIARIKGLSQFGFIGAVGVVLCWLATFFVLPVMTLITERMWRLVRVKGMPSRESAVMDVMSNVAAKSPAIILALAIVAAVVSFEVVIRFVPNAVEYDFSKMRNATSATMGTEALEKRVSRLFKHSMTPAAVLVDDPEDGPKVCAAVDRQNQALPETDRRVGSCYSIFDLLPKDQDQKLPILRKIKGLLDPAVIARLDSKMRNKIAGIQKSLIDRPLSIEDLPADLTRHFQDLDGRRGAAVFINPRAGMLLSDGRNLLKFAETIRNIELDDGRVFHAAGESLIYSDLISIIKSEAPVLTIASLVGVIVFVAITLGSVGISAIIVGCLLWGVTLMLGCAALYDIKINFFNFIVLPLTFGIGVDYSLNMAVRLKQDDGGSIAHAIRHTGGAVALCSATTIIGYYVLTRASNQALATFGTAAVIGEVACLVAAVAIVPAIFALVRRKRSGSR